MTRPIGSRVPLELRNYNGILLGDPTNSARRLKIDITDRVMVMNQILIDTDRSDENGPYVCINFSPVADSYALTLMAYAIDPDRRVVSVEPIDEDSCKGVGMRSVRLFLTDAISGTYYVSAHYRLSKKYQDLKDLSKMMFGLVPALEKAYGHMVDDQRTSGETTREGSTGEDNV